MRPQIDAAQAVEAHHAEASSALRLSLPAGYLQYHGILPVQRKSSGADVQEEQPLKSGSGKPLPPEVLAKMEAAFGADFSQVRIHEGPQAQALGALAYTQGTDIHFAPGMYAPHLPAGQELLGHELAHIVQQAAGRVGTTRQSKGAALNDDSSLEHEADEMGRKAARGEPARGFRQDIADFQAAHPTQAIRAGQGRVLGHSGPAAQAKDSSGVIQRCGGGGTPPPPAFEAPLGKKTTSLAGDFGDFTVNHGLIKNPKDGASGQYEIEITMKPNAKSKGSNLRFVQTVRRGTVPGSWATKATDPGMTADRAKRVAGDGWRVDRADPSTDKTPFYGHTIDSTGALTNTSTANPGAFNGSNVRLYDRPAVADPSVLEFSSNAMDDSSGLSFGAVAWGFQFSSAASTYTEETPRLLAAGDPRLAGQKLAYEKWNEVYGPSGTVDKNVKAIPGVAASP